MVQRKSAHIPQSDYRCRSSVSKMLEGLLWKSKKNQRTIFQLTIVFTLFNIEVIIPSEEFFGFNCTRSRNGYSKKLTKYQPKTDMLKYAFDPWTIPVCNDMPEEVVEPKPILLKNEYVQNIMLFSSILKQKNTIKYLNIGEMSCLYHKTWVCFSITLPISHIPCPYSKTCWTCTSSIFMATRSNT